MRKCDEATDPNSCWNKGRSDELTFVLLGRDAAAPAAIRAWAAERIRLGKNTPDDAQVVEAMACARLMEAEREPTPGLESAFGDWGHLPAEPCRFCRKQGKVYFARDEGPEGRDGHQPMRCGHCGRSWVADSATA